VTMLFPLVLLLAKIRPPHADALEPA
jgi:hypothetical protein